MSGSERQQVILQFIAQQLLDDRGGAHLTEEDDLLASGLIDSLGVMRLVRFIEDQFEVTVPPADITIEHFSNVATIVAYIASLDAQHERTPSA